MSYLSQLFVLIIISLISICIIFRIVIIESNRIFKRNEIFIHTFIRENREWISKCCRNGNWSLEDSKHFWADFIILRVIKMDESSFKTALVKKYSCMLKELIWDKTSLMEQLPK